MPQLLLVLLLLFHSQTIYGNSHLVATHFAIKIFICKFRIYLKHRVSINWAFQSVCRYWLIGRLQIIGYCSVIRIHICQPNICRSRHRTKPRDCNWWFNPECIEHLWNLATVSIGRFCSTRPVETFPYSINNEWMIYFLFRLNNGYRLHGFRLAVIVEPSINSGADK